MILRVLIAIANAILYTCVGGAVIAGGIVAYELVLFAPFWTQVIAAAVFAALVYYFVKERDDDEE